MGLAKRYVKEFYSDLKKSVINPTTAAQLKKILTLCDNGQITSREAIRELVRISGKAERNHTIEKSYLYHLYFSEGRYFVDYYGGGIIHSYETEEGAREAIKYHFDK